MSYHEDSSAFLPHLLWKWTWQRQIVRSPAAFRAQAARMHNYQGISCLSASTALLSVARPSIISSIRIRKLDPPPWHGHAVRQCRKTPYYSGTVVESLSVLFRRLLKLSSNQITRVGVFQIPGFDASLFPPEILSAIRQDIPLHPKLSFTEITFSPSHNTLSSNVRESLKYKYSFQLLCQSRTSRQQRHCCVRAAVMHKA